MSILSSHPNFMPSSRLEKSMWNSRIGCNGVRWSHFGIFNEIPLVWLELEVQGKKRLREWQWERERECVYTHEAGWGGNKMGQCRQNPCPLQDRKNLIGLD